jgi:hypothetical protein
MYNPWDHPGLIKKFTFKCTDGRYGTGTIAMNPDLKSGIGLGKANDGTTFDLAIGWSVQQIHLWVVTFLLLPSPRFGAALGHEFYRDARDQRHALHRPCGPFPDLLLPRLY